MTVTNIALIDFLKTICGPRGVTTDADDMAPWLTDWRGRYHGAAQAMVAPASTDELAAVVRCAATHQVPIVPQGGNSGMVGGATPDANGEAILLSLRRMNTVRNIDAAGRLLTAEAGVILQNLHIFCAAEGLRFPLTLGGKGSATVGGLVATNAGGTQVLRHGTMRALVQGIEAVLPDGSIYNGLAALKRDNRGYDLKHLLIGSEGTLGIITAATLHLVPALVDRTVIWAGVESTSKARDLLLFLQESAGAQMEGFEILPQHCLDNVIAHIPGTRPPLDAPHPWHVLIELVRDDATALAPASLAESLMVTALARRIITDATLSASEAQAEAFWKIRDSISESERASGPAMQHDISVPVARMGEFIDAVSPQIEAAFPGTKAVGFGHMGDGNIHYHVLAPAGVDPQAWTQGDGQRISAAVNDAVTAYGGSISAEHGIGQMKRDELARLSDPGRMYGLRAIKSAFDPLGIMNPGKLVA